MIIPEPHADDCDCGDCCFECGNVASIDDDGRCESCAQSRIESDADAYHDLMKEGVL